MQITKRGVLGQDSSYIQSREGYTEQCVAALCVFCVDSHKSISLQQGLPWECCQLECS